MRPLPRTLAPFRARVLAGALALLAGGGASAQSGASGADTATFKDATTGLWVNTYGNIRVSDRVFWIAQTHFRFVGTESGEGATGRPFVGEFAQLYNRHAVSYLFSKKFRASLGGVLRVNYNTGGVAARERRTVPEWRIWHEYLWAVPLGRAYFYHRVRLEHRWTRGFRPDAEWVFRNRWRYMLSAKVPINKPKLGVHAFYVGPEAEVILQSGRTVAGSPLEDLRLHTSFGYIATPRVTFAAGLMYSMGQTLGAPAVYKQKWTPRLHAYFSPDWRKIKSKLPEIHRNE